MFYHEGGRHVGSYYGYSSGTTGKVKIVEKGTNPSSATRPRSSRLRKGDCHD